MERKVAYESTTVPSTWLPPALSKKTCSLSRAGKLARTFWMSMRDACEGTVSLRYKNVGQ